MIRGCGDSEWDWVEQVLSREEKKLVSVLMLLVEMDLSEKELDRLLVRVRRLYPEIRVVPPGWDEEESRAGEQEKEMTRPVRPWHNLDSLW